MKKAMTIWASLVVLLLASIFALGASPANDMPAGSAERHWLSNERSGATMQHNTVYTSGVSLLGVLVFGSDPGSTPQWNFATGIGTPVLSGSAVINGVGAGTTGLGSGATLTLRYAVSMEKLSVSKWESLAASTSGSTPIGTWNVSSGTSKTGKAFTPEVSPYVGIFCTGTGVSQFLAPEIPVFSF